MSIMFRMEGSYVRCNAFVLVCWCKKMLVDHEAYVERKVEECESHGNTEVCTKESWTLEDCQGRVSRNFWLWNDCLRVTEAAFQRIVALERAFGCVLGTSLRFRPNH